MNSSDKVRRILDLVENDPDLIELIGIAPPQAVLMPFARERQKTYVVVVVFIGRQSLNRDILASICRRIVQILRASGLLDDLDGLEIMPSLAADGRTERLFRLSILSGAFAAAEKFAPSDIDKWEPAEGINSKLYKKQGW